MADGLDLLPRIVLHPPGGAVIVDPWAAGGEAGTVSIGGVSVPYEIVWGASNLPPESAQLTTTLSSGVWIVAALAAVWFLSRRW